MSSVWVVDAAPLILLGKIGCLALLHRLASSVIVPRGVAREIEQGPERDPARQWVRVDGRGFVTEVGAIAPVVAAWDLGLGESQVLQFCLGAPEREAIVDDKAARECASALGVPFRGTIGVLGLAKQKGLVPALRPLLDALVAKGFRIAKPVLDHALELAGE